MNAFSDKCFHSKKNWKQFVERYKNSLRDKCEKESHSDYESFNSTIPCVYDYYIEKQFQLAYTKCKVLGGSRNAEEEELLVS